MSANSCGCTSCPNGMASEYIFAVSGITNTMQCAFCTQINGQYVLPTAPLSCVNASVMVICGYDGWSLEFQVNANKTIKATLLLEGSTLNWTQDNLPDCMQVMTLTRSGSTTICINFPDTIVVTPVGPAMDLSSILSSISCQPALQPGLAPGSNLGPWVPPFVGTPPATSPTVGVCLNGGDPFTPPPKQLTLVCKPSCALPGLPPATKTPSCCASGCGCGCGCSGTGDSSESSGCCSGTCKSSGCGCCCCCGDFSPAFRDLLDRITHLGPAQLNHSNGNLFLPLRQPGGGLFAPAADLFYNSLSPAASEFGYGWSNLFQRVLTAAMGSTTATLTTGTGGVLQYTDKDANGRYLPPGGAQNTLVASTGMMGSTFTETQPDGFALNYNTSGTLVTLKNAAGGLWMLSHDAGTRLTKILDPVAGVITLAYDGSNKLKRIVDVAGRIASFTVDTNGNLVRRTAPDLSIVTFLYDTNHRLRTYIDEDAERWSFTFDSNNFAKGLLTPRGFRTTFS